MEAISGILSGQRTRHLEVGVTVDERHATLAIVQPSGRWLAAITLDAVGLDDLRGALDRVAIELHAAKVRKSAS